ncbi:MAG: hypothetical protein ACRETO_01670 [Gammaproteobacteria bacterium]
MNENTTSIDIYTGNAGRYFRFETDGYPTSESDYPTSGSDPYHRSDYKPELLTPSTESGFIYKFPSVLYRNGSKKAGMTDDDELGGTNSTSQFLIEKTFGDTYIFRDGVTFEYAAQGARTFVFGRRYMEYHADVAAFSDAIDYPDLTTDTWIQNGFVPSIDLTGANNFTWKNNDGTAIDTDTYPAFFTSTFGDRYEYHCGRLYTYTGALQYTDSNGNTKPVRTDDSGNDLKNGHGQTYNYGTGYTENLICYWDSTHKKYITIDHGTIDDTWKNNSDFLSYAGQTTDIFSGPKNADDFSHPWDWSNTVSEITVGNSYSYYGGNKVDAMSGCFEERVAETRHRYAGSSHEYVGSADKHGECTSVIYADPTSHVYGVSTDYFVGRKNSYSLSGSFSVELSGSASLSFGGSFSLSAGLASEINLAPKISWTPAWVEMATSKFKIGGVKVENTAAKIKQISARLENLEVELNHVDDRVTGAEMLLEPIAMRVMV